MNALDLVLPTRCAGCNRPGPHFCPVCLGGWGPPERVHIPGLGPPAWALTQYDGVARNLLIAFKERGRRALAAWFGALVAAALATILPRPWVLVPAPSRREAVRERGGDHMVRVARAAEEAAVAPVLGFAAGVRDSVGLGPGARRRNLEGRVLVHGRPPPGSAVLLDDVITTGATALVCVRALREAGVRTHAVLALTTARALV